MELNQTTIQEPKQPVNSVVPSDMNIPEFMNRLKGEEKTSTSGATQPLHVSVVQIDGEEYLLPLELIKQLKTEVKEQSDSYQKNYLNELISDFKHLKDERDYLKGLSDYLKEQNNLLKKANTELLQNGIDKLPDSFIREQIQKLHSVIDTEPSDITALALRMGMDGKQQSYNGAKGLNMIMEFLGVQTGFDFVMADGHETKLWIFNPPYNTKGWDVLELIEVNGLKMPMRRLTDLGLQEIPDVLKSLGFDSCFIDNGRVFKRQYQE